MARLDQSPTVHRRYCRYFSDEFKRKKVREIEKKLVSVSEVCKEYEVTSAAVYKWIYKFSLMRKKGVKMVIEAKSDTTRLKAYQEKIKELEQLVGQKQFEIEFLNKQLELASSQYDVDLKKKRFGKPLSGSGKTEKNTATK